MRAMELLLLDLFAFGVKRSVVHFMCDCPDSIGVPGKSDRDAKCAKLRKRSTSRVTASGQLQG